MLDHGMHDFVVLKALQNCRGKLSFGCILCTFCAKPGSLHFGMVSGGRECMIQAFCVTGWVDHMVSEHSGLPVWRFPNTVVSLYGVFIDFPGASQFEVV